MSNFSSERILCSHWNNNSPRLALVNPRKVLYSVQRIPGWQTIGVDVLAIEHDWPWARLERECRKLGDGGGIPVWIDTESSQYNKRVGKRQKPLGYIGKNILMQTTSPEYDVHNHGPLSKVLEVSFQRRSYERSISREILTSITGKYSVIIDFMMGRIRTIQETNSKEEASWRNRYLATIWMWRTNVYRRSYNILGTS